MVHPTCFTSARATGQKAGLTGEFLILLEESNTPLPCSIPTIEQLIMFGSSQPETFKPLLLRTEASLYFSSGVGETATRRGLDSEGTTERRKGFEIIRCAGYGNCMVYVRSSTTIASTSSTKESPNNNIENLLLISSRL